MKKIIRLSKQILTMHIHTNSADFCLIFVELPKKLSCAQNKALQVRTDLNLSTGDKQTQLKAVHYIEQRKRTPILCPYLIRHCEKHSRQHVYKWAKEKETVKTMLCSSVS